jgi:dihydropteroate synthase
VRILSLEHKPDLERELASVGADAACWHVFAAKRAVAAVRLDGLSTATANILKQTCIGVGADCAVSAKAASGRVRRSDAVLFATPRQLERLVPVLERQPECVARLAPELHGLWSRFSANPPTMRIGGRRFDWGSRTYVMGILNVTPDSFSDGGRFLAPEAALEQAEQLAREGADLIDVGAESTRPGARPVSAREQARRLVPVLRLLSRRVKTPVSVDTASAEVARAAVAEGAAMLNDVTALSDPKMPGVIARAGVPCVVMHMRGRPRTMQRNPRYSDLMAEVFDGLAAALDRGAQAGVRRMIVDPGIGFGKRLEHNLELLRRLSELRSLGRPILVGPSRKRFIGELTGAGPQERVAGTVAACVVAAQHGAHLVRVHDVGPVRQALRIADSIAGKG